MSRKPPDTVVVHIPRHLYEKIRKDIKRSKAGPRTVPSWLRRAAEQRLWDAERYLNPAPHPHRGYGSD